MESFAKIMGCLPQKPNGSKALNDEITVFDRSDYEYFEVPAETPRQLHERLIASGFPVSIADLTFDDLTVDDKNRAKIEKAKAFAKNPQSGLYICGEFGTGKTWLAAAIGNAVARQCLRVHFETFSSITDKLITAQKNDSFSEKWERYVHKPDLLIIDDIGKENPTEWKLQTLFKLIDERGSADLPMVFTSNYGLAKLCERISTNNNDSITVGAIKDRLKCFVPLTLTGGSRRRRFDQNEGD